MTMLATKEVTCAVCNHKSTQDWLLSTNAMGSSDLDTRPPEMRRSTIHAWVEECPECGYCSPDIAIAVSDKDYILGLVVERQYRDLLNRADFPKLTNRFLCHALLQTDFTFDNPDRAFFAYLNAAWAADDAKNETASNECRKMAIDFFNLGRVTVSETSLAIKADIQRRIGDFEGSKESCVQGLAIQITPTVFSVLHFQMKLCDNKDTGCYTVKDAVE